MTIRNKIFQIAGAGALLALFAGSALADVITPIQLANPNFEDDNASGGDVWGATGWTPFGNGAFTTDGTNGPGAHPNCCSPVADTLNNSFKAFGTGGAYQSFAATAGDTFNMSGVGQNYGEDRLLNDSRAFLQIAFFDAAGLPAGTAAGGNVWLGFNLFDGNVIDANTSIDVWFELGVGTAPAPDNTAEVRFIVLMLEGGGGAGFFDTISANQVVVPVPAAVWLFGSGLLGLVGMARRKQV